MTAIDATQVMLVDDHESIRRALELLLRDAGFRVIGSVATVAEARRAIPLRRPDVAIVDLRLTDGSGAELTRELVAAEPALRVLIYSAGDDVDAVREALTSGAAGIILKGRPAGQLIDAVKAVARGDGYTDPAVARLVSNGPARSALTRREVEVLELVAAGLNAEEIAARLGLSRLTIETHLRNASRKLGANNRAHALAIALQTGEIELPR